MKMEPFCPFRRQVKGNVAWEYTVQDNEIDFLAEGETLEIVYKILITDDSNVGDGSGTNEPETITQKRHNYCYLARTMLL